MFMDPIFIGIYVVELAIKMYALRLYFFRDGWNWFGWSTLCTCSHILSETVTHAGSDLGAVRRCPCIVGGSVNQ